MASAYGEMLYPARISETEYYLEVGNLISAVSFVPVATEGSAVFVEGIEVVQGSSAEEQQLNVGENRFSIKAVKDGKTEEVTITVVRKAVPGNSSQSKNITVSFKLMGDTKHGNDPHDKFETWVEKENVTVSSGSTVKDVFEKVLREKNIPFTITFGGNYVSSINGLAEFDNGPNSGWMYTVNGSYPLLGLAEKAVSNGDDIVWHYTDDYTKEDTGFKPDDSPGKKSSSKKDDSVEVIAPQSEISDQPVVLPKTEALAAFNDVKPDDWFYTNISFAVQKGLFNGMSATAFEPDTFMTRAMLVTVLLRIAGAPVEGTADFTDVESGQWYTDAVAWAAANDIIGGYGNGLFGTNDNITREQMAVILYRYAMKKGYDTSAKGEVTRFNDNDKISSYAMDAIAWAVGSGMVSGKGDGILDPSGNATRAEVAAILQRFVEGFLNN